MSVPRKTSELAQVGQNTGGGGRDDLAPRSGGSWVDRMGRRIALHRNCRLL